MKSEIVNKLQFNKKLSSLRSDITKLNMCWKEFLNIVGIELNKNVLEIAANIEKLTKEIKDKIKHL